MKIDRLLSIVIYLLNHDKTTATELSRVFEASVRTIYRDLETLSLAGIPVMTQQGSGGGVSLMPQFRLDRQVFTPGELMALVSALHGVGTALDDSAVNRALDKVRTLAPASGAVSGIEIDFSGWEEPERFRALLSLFYNAINRRRVMRFEYVNLKGEFRRRDVEPVKLFFRGSAWYLLGWCRSRKDYRFFRLGRIQSPELTGELFREHTDLDLTGNPDQYWTREDPVEIVFRFPEADRARLFGRIGEDCLSPDGEGWLRASVRFPLDEWVYGWLMGIADVITVVSPVFVREELLRRLEKAVKNNQT